MPSGYIHEWFIQAQKISFRDLPTNMTMAATFGAVTAINGRSERR